MSNELTEREDMAPAVFDPSADAGAGLDQLGGTDYKTPFIKQMQSMSPELKKSSGKFVEGAAEGDFVNSSTLENLGDSFQAVVAAILPRVVEWRHPDAGGGIENVFEPSRAPSDYRLNEKRKMVRPNGNVLEPTYYYYVIVNSPAGMFEAVLPFKGTGINDAKKYQAMFKAKTVKAGPNRGKSLPTFAHIVEFTSSPRQSRDYSWMGTSMSIVGEVEDASLYNRAKAFHDAAPTRQVGTEEGVEEVVVETDAKVVNENI